ncbi:response regulator [bacterium]|nr:response regulator [bacterium]
MKFLIIDDEEDIREVLSMLITSHYDVNILQAVDGQNALDVLNSDGPFDLVLCDFNMPHKNGAEVYAEVRKNSNAPFILISTDQEKFKKQVPNPTFFDGIAKPFDDKDLTKKIESLISQKNIPVQKESYLPVSIDLLEKIEVPGVPLFIKLNASQYIKVLNDSAQFNSYEVVRFKNKKLTHLYVELVDLKVLISNYRRNIFAKADWDNINTDEALANLQGDWSLILEASRNFGWSPSVTDLAKENIAKTLAVIEKNQELKKTFERLKLSNSKNYVSPHCYSLVFLTGEILKELAWNSPRTQQKMTFACLLHDMELSDTMFSNKQELIKNQKLHEELHHQTNYKIFNHATIAAEFVTNWTSCPPDVDKLIHQHHEKFDGTGFPQKLNFLTIFPLAAVLIIAEDLIYQSLHYPEKKLTDYLAEHESYYNKGDIKKIYAAAVNVIQKTSC